MATSIDPAPLADTRNWPLPGVPQWEGRDFALTDLFAIVWRRIAMVLLVSALVALPLLAVVALMPSQYTASATLMIDRHDRYSVDMRPSQSTMPLPDKASISSEMEMLRSGDLLRAVVLQLNLHDTAEFRVKEQKTGGLGALLESWREALFGPGAVVPAAPLPAIALPQDVTALTMTDADLAAHGLTEGELGRVVERVSKKLDLWNLNDSRAIEVRFTSRDPALSADVVNAILAKYFEVQTAIRQAAAKRIVALLDTELDGLRKELETAEMAAQTYRAQSVAEIGADASLLLKQITEVGTSILTAQAEKQRAVARQSAAQSAFDSEGPSGVMALLDSDAVNRLFEREAELERDIRELGERYGADHPRLARPREELQSLKAQIAAEAQTRLDNLAHEVTFAEGRIEGLRNELKILQSHYDTAARRDIRQRELDREVEADRALYETFVARVRETERMPVDVSSGIVVSQATPPVEPSKPQRLILAFAVLLFAGLAGTGTAILTDYRARARIRTSLDVSTELGLRCSETVPMVSRRPMLGRGRDLADWPAARPRTAFAGALHRLARHALSASRDEKGKLIPIVFTSNIDGAGKTTLTFGVAKILAREKRVLVIASDDRPEAVGPNVLIRQLCDEDATESGGRRGRFDVTTFAHHVSSSPTREELSGNLSALLPLYDVILFDAPAFRTNPDFVCSAASVARVLFVATWGGTRKADVMEVLQTLQHNNARLWGLVLNKVRPTSRGRTAR